MNRMKKVEVDARGLDCPKPVIYTKKALEDNKGSSITTIVDNDVAKNNVMKLAKKLGYEVKVTDVQGVSYIDISSGFLNTQPETLPESKPNFRDLVLFVGSDKLGEGSDELGSILMKGYFYTLTENKPYPKSILFVNRGVLLTIEESEVLDHIRVLESEGVEILSCGTCLDYYHIKDKLAVGGVTNMYTIVDTMNNAKNTVKIVGVLWKQAFM